MKRVRMGSLVAARRSDSRATVSDRPSSSKRMLPGLTTATQYSGAPLPLPMRVSGGRAVTDLSGKMRIQSLPLRFMLRVSATRAASIWTLVIQARSRVWSAKEPKSILRLREAKPLRLPRWDLRYLTRLGRSGIGVGRLGGGDGGGFVLAADPALDADLARNGHRFREAVVDVGAQRVERHLALAVF